MSTPHDADSLATRASIFIKLNDREAAPREIAWATFRERYAPIIAGFAKRLGASSGDLDDIIQDVMLGFFAVSPRFVYDPARGRFRGYLKVAALRAARDRLQRRGRLDSTPLETIADDSADLDEAWSQEERRQNLQRAIAQVRETYARRADSRTTFRAFEEYVLNGRSAEDVATEFGLTIESVYQAKRRITAALQVVLLELEQED